MQLTHISTTNEQFADAVSNIDTYDKLVVVLAHIANSKEIYKQLVAAYNPDFKSFSNLVFGYQFNDVFLNAEAAFGTSYTTAEFERIMNQIASFIVAKDQVESTDDVVINYSAIKRLGGIGVDVSINFEGAINTDIEDDTLTNIGVTFHLLDFQLEV
jgi:hypothetical protein